VLTQGPGQWSAADAYTHAQLGAAEFAWMAALTHRLRWSEDLFLCHASPRSDLEYLLETVEPGGVRIASAAEVRTRLDGVDAPVVLCGHTHWPRVLRSASGQLIVNPGSVGLPAFDDDHPYAHVIENGAPDARYAIVERVHDRWLAALIAVPYAHEPMARLADERGMPDWAIALRTGYMG
jgi:diadenosine tetraphosphatase ApaH/serine/threonine PP2A family protein phosphatase